MSNGNAMAFMVIVKYHDTEDQADVVETYFGESLDVVREKVHGVVGCDRRKILLSEEYYHRKISGYELIP